MYLSSVLVHSLNLLQSYKLRAFGLQVPGDVSPSLGEDK